MQLFRIVSVLEFTIQLDAGMRPHFQVNNSESINCYNKNKYQCSNQFTVARTSKVNIMSRR